MIQVIGIIGIHCFEIEPGGGRYKYQESRKSTRSVGRRMGLATPEVDVSPLAHIMRINHKR